MNELIDIIQDESLTYQQKLITLARLAENSYEGVKLSASEQSFLDRGIISDLGEGKSPYRPRYILPDYKKYLEQGSKFLRISPANCLEDVINNLLILYKHVPSITTMPVYLGNLDELLEPYISDEDKAYEQIKRFLIHIDRTITDSFSHANIGPKETRAGLLILKAERELKNSVPNLTLKYNHETSEKLALEAVITGLEVSKPYFSNHEMHKNEYGIDYGIASCYNGLPIGGGAYTLVRLNLKKLVRESISTDDFFSRQLPLAVDNMLAIMDKRIHFLVEESDFFKSHFLIKENLIAINRFVAMFGLFGLAEAVNDLFEKESISHRYGHGEEAALMAERIIKAIQDLVDRHDNAHCEFSDNKFLLHAQSGISSDIDVSPGCRIPIGDEPELIDHILFTSRFHRYFPSGTSDIFTFDETAKNNPAHVLDIIKGAMKNGLRTFAFYSSTSDLIRITGYLVKKSDLNKYELDKQALHDTVALGKESLDKQPVLNRKIHR